jgi:hypothetical protein
MDTDKSRYKIERRKDVSVWYIGIYRPISSTRLNIKFLLLASARYLWSQGIQRNC